MRTRKVQTQAEAVSGKALRLVAADSDDLERRYSADVWRAEELGVPAARGRGAVNFTRIHPPWLRDATKRWARHRAGHRLRVRHASPRMTAVYAHLHDATLRAEFERYCQTRVDIEGRQLGFDPTAVTADAEWVKHRLARAADTLPNGYCGRPPQQDCPHLNASLTELAPGSRRVVRPRAGASLASKCGQIRVGTGSFGTGRVPGRWPGCHG